MSKRIPIFLAGGYAALAAIAVLITLAGEGSLSGIFLVILAAPWLQMLSRVLDSVAPGAFDGMTAGLLIGVVGAVINACLIYRISGWVLAKLATR